jgi:4'-phosphopantetheinyl transferase
MIPEKTLRPIGPPAGVVDVWCVHLDDPDLPHAALAATLEPGEREHAARLRTGGRGWAAGRGVEREILAGYLGVDAAVIRFTAGELGKPRLLEAPELRFSFSRTDGLALLAVARDREIGVDVERENDRTDVERVAHEFLPPDEAAALGRVPPQARRAAFFASWTRHEARLKLHGRGLAAGPFEPSPGSRVVVRDLELPSGFAGAVAAENVDWSVRIRTFQCSIPRS